MGTTSGADRNHRIKGPRPSHIIRDKLGLSCAKLKSNLASKASQPKGYVKLYRLQEYALFLLENYYSGWGGVGGWSEN